MKALGLLCAFAALSACDPDTADPSDAAVGNDGPLVIRCDGTPDGYCPCAAATNGGVQYLFCPDVATWEQARDRCRQYGHELVKIESQAEHDYLWATALELIGPNDWWIGATDSAAEGQFVWTDGSAAEFTSWAPEQPDQGGAEETIEEDCVEMHEAEGGHWNDLACTTDYLDFICEGAI
jgi:hypothetical protein